MAVSTEYGERIAALESEIETERRHLATKADISELKMWVLWRMIIVVGIAQAIGVGALLQFLPRP